MEIIRKSNPEPPIERIRGKSHTAVDGEDGHACEVVLDNSSHAWPVHVEIARRGPLYSGEMATAPRPHPMSLDELEDAIAVLEAARDEVRRVQGIPF